MHNIFETFDDYVNHFDLEDKNILYKKEHTYRVVDITKQIIDNEDFSGVEKKLCIIASLLHDIGRFNQFKIYKTYNDLDSKDHGDIGYDVLIKEDYILKYINIEYKDVILNAVKYHNKLEIDKLDELSKKICKVIRDADKIDIMLTQSINDNEKAYKEFEYIKINKLDDDVIKNILHEEMISNKYVTNEVMGMIRQFGFLYDINYRTSFKIINNYDIINKKLNLLDKVLEDKSQFKLIKLKISDYLESNIKL